MIIILRAGRSLIFCIKTENWCEFSWFGQLFCWNSPILYEFSLPRPPLAHRPPAEPQGGCVRHQPRGWAQIRAIDVLLGVEETVTPVFCVDAEGEFTCPRVDGCPTHWLWNRLDQAIYEVLDSVTLAELCEHSHNLLWNWQYTYPRYLDSHFNETPVR